jgi:hypothetical protein
MGKSTNCIRCGRVLISPKSVKIRHGPVCAKKLGITVIEHVTKKIQTLDSYDEYIEGVCPIDKEVF